VLEKKDQQFREEKN